MEAEHYVIIDCKGDGKMNGRERCAAVLAWMDQDVPWKYPAEQGPDVRSIKVRVDGVAQAEAEKKVEEDFRYLDVTDHRPFVSIRRGGHSRRR